jgi:hypothetical protein
MGLGEPWFWEGWGVVSGHIHSNKHTRAFFSVANFDDSVNFFSENKNIKTKNL